MNSILDLSSESNQLFVASVLAVLCESSPITISLQDIEKYWRGDIKRLQYDMVADAEGKTGSITFSLKDKWNK